MNPVLGIEKLEKGSPEYLKIQKILDKKKVKDNLHNILAGASVGVVAIGLAAGSTLVANSMFLAIVSTTGVILAIYKLPTFMKKLMARFAVVADLGVTIGVYAFLGQTATALIASGVVGTFVSIYLQYLRKKYGYDKEE